ncbi:WxL domain-containing protein [Bacillus thuringiensis]|uniref:WxL domain-containing protein n=1 Tax=Bacillus thuringiensis TaxID=1428 RepID=UPI001C676905|nr:WxL domain-containing protein [Bacillus thuringiensis]
MKKVIKTSAILLASLSTATILGGGVASAATPASYNSKATVEFVPNNSITPPVDPENPDITNPVTPVDPEDPTKPVAPGTAGPLSIDFASSLSFGQQTISSGDTTYFAHPQVLEDSTGNKTSKENYVQVTDSRGTFEGWTLSVKSDGQFRLAGADVASTAPGDVLTGARLEFDKGHVNAPTGIDSSVTPSTVTNSKIEVSPADTVLVAAKANEGMGTWIYGLGTSADYDASATTASDIATKAPITLTVPGSTTKKADTYTTNLIWTLSNTPGN